MKSERRHELQTNTLARGIERLPTVGREYGSRIALAVVLVLLVIVLVRLWVTNRTQQADTVAAQLTMARSVLASLRGDVFLFGMPAERIADRRKQTLAAVEEYVENVLRETTDPVRQAEAKVLRGDLYWQVASMGELSEATTRPSLKLERTPQALLDEAAKQYGDVVARAGQVPAPIVASARLGLAAIAENRAEWEKAREQYQAVAADAGVDAAVKARAGERLAQLDELRKPVLLGTPRPPQETQPATTPTQPVTQPGTGPVTSPMTRPETIPLSPAPAPAAPATLPATTSPAAPQS